MESIIKELRKTKNAKIDEIREIINIQKQRKNIPKLSFFLTKTKSQFKNRKSDRNFSQNLVEKNFEKILTQSFIANNRKVKNPYSLPHLPYPAAGGLNSCEIYTWTNFGKYRGLSKYNNYSNSLHIINKKFDIKKMLPYHDNFSINNVCFAIIFTLDLRCLIKKYGKRGYKYGLLEIGHAAQNVCIASSKYGTSILPIGYFSENYLTNKINRKEISPEYVLIGGGKLWDLS